ERAADQRGCFPSAAARRQAGELRVLLHLIPFRLASADAREWLQRIVESIEHEVLARIEKTFGPPLAHRIAQDVRERGPEIGLPDKGQQIQLARAERLRVISHALHRAIVAYQPAVGVEQQASLLPLRSLLWKF